MKERLSRSTLRNPLSGGTMPKDDTGREIRNIEGDLKIVL